MFRKATKTSETVSPVSITDTAPCEKALRVHVAPQAIAPVRQAVIGEFQRQAALPGFRKGKAPADLVGRQYAKEIQEETLHRVTKQAFEQAVHDHQLKPLGPFEVHKADFSEGSDLTLEATVEVEPAFALGTYNGLALTRELQAVTPDEVDKALAALQESMAQLVPSGPGEAKERRVPPLDDELAKDLGFEHLAKIGRAHV